MMQSSVSKNKCAQQLTNSIIKLVSSREATLKPLNFKRNLYASRTAKSLRIKNWKMSSVKLSFELKNSRIR